MTETELKERLSSALEQAGLEGKPLEALASHLVWRIGRLSDDAPVTVRVGLASNVALFAELPKLRSASEAELEEALREDTLRVEWVGRAPA